MPGSAARAIPANDSAAGANFRLRVVYSASMWPRDQPLWRPPVIDKRSKAIVAMPMNELWLL